MAEELEEMDLDEDIIKELAEAPVGREYGDDQNSSTRAGRVVAVKVLVVYKRKDLVSSMAKVKKAWISGQAL